LYYCHSKLTWPDLQSHNRLLVSIRDIRRVGRKHGTKQMVLRDVRLRQLLIPQSLGGSHRIRAQHSRQESRHVHPQTVLVPLNYFWVRTF